MSVRSYFTQLMQRRHQSALARSRLSRSRRALFESLEPRILLSVSPTVVGTPFDDNDISGHPAIYGTLGSDVIDAQAGDDSVYGDGGTAGSGVGGNDVIVGGDGRDDLWGEDGDDWIEPGPMLSLVTSSQSVDGGDGVDTLFLLGAPTDYQFSDHPGGFIVDSLSANAPEGQVAASGIERVAFGVSVLDYANGTAQPVALVDVSQLVATGSDRAPIALADTIVVGRGATEVLIPLARLLGNDIDFDGDTFDIAELLGTPFVTVEGFDASSTSALPDVPAQYALDFPDGLVRASFTAPLTAPVTFGYRLADAATGLVLGNVATVTLQPSPLPTAGDDTLRATLGQDNYFDVAALLANDSPGLTFRGIVPGSVTQGDNVAVEDYGSSLRVASFGTTPTSISFAYEAQDAYGEVVTANVTVEVFNRPPIVADGAAVVAPGGTYTLRFAELATFPGTFDPNGDTLSMAFYSTEVPATVTLMGFEDRIEFGFAANYAGDYVLDFALADATGGQDAGRFRFLTTLPAAPVAVADTLRWGMSTSHGEAFGTFSLSRLLANDVLAPGVKVYGDFTTVAQPANGTFYVEPGNPNSVVPTTDPLNLMLSYMPRVGFTGIDTVTYAIVDELGRRSTTTLTFDVSVPRPVVPDTTITLPPGATSVTFPASALLANATLTGTGKLSGYAIRFDADSGVLQASADPATGNYTSFTYTPDANTVLGQDAFFVGVIDQGAEGGSARASTFVRFVSGAPTTVALVSVDAGSALEGSAVNPLNNGALSFVIRRSGDLSLGSTVDFTLDAAPGSTLTADDIGMVAEGGDNLRSGLGTFAAVFDPGQETETVYVFATGDFLTEPDETMRLTLTGGTGAALATTGPLSAMGTFINDDAYPEFALAQASAGSVAEGNGPGDGGALSFVIQRTGDLGFESTVSFVLSKGTFGAAGSDYGTVKVDGIILGTGTGGYTVTFAAGEASRTITMYAVGDRVPEIDAALTLTLTGATRAVLSATGTLRADGVFLNDDVYPEFALAQASAGSVAEGNGPGDGGALSFVIQRTGDLGFESTVSFVLSKGTFGAAGSDYGTVKVDGIILGTGTGGYRVTFAAGEASRTITMYAVGDRVPEIDAALTLTLTGATRAVLSATGTLRADGVFLNDDVPEPPADLSLSLDIAAERLLAGDSADVVVRVDNAGPASAGGSVQLSPGLGVSFLGASEGFDSVTGIWSFGPIAPGAFAEIAIETVFAIAGTPDIVGEIITASVPDPDSTPGNGTTNGEDDVAAAGIQVTVPPPTIAWSDSYNSNLESMPDGTGGLFLVGFARGGDLTGASTLHWTVAAADPPSWLVLGARAAQSADIVGGFRSGTLDFAPGQATAEIRLQYVNDTLSEPAEFFALTLTGATNGRIAGQSEWIEKIRDDEPTLYSIAGTTDATEGTAPGAGGELAFVIQREGVLATGDVIVTVGGSGTPGSGDAADLVDGFGTHSVSFAEGETEKTVTLAVSPDGLAESDETVLVTLTGLQHATDSAIGSPASALLTIFNDDAPIADLSLDSRILVGGEIVGVDEFGSPAGTTYTLRLTAANAAGAGIPADARVRITFPDAAIDWRGLQPEDADVVVDDVSATGLQTLWWQVGPLAPGESAFLDLQLASLLPTEVQLLAEVWESTALDFDSTPGNGVGAHEDDALAVVLYATPGDPPIARPDSYVVVEGGTLTVSGSQGLLANDTLPPGSTFQVSGNFPGIILNVAADGGFTFVAPRGILADTDYAYTVTLTDAFGQVSAPAAFTVHVQNRPNPVGVADVYSVYEGETLRVDAAHGLLSNDPPPPGGGAAVNNSLTGIGVLALDSTGAFTFVAPARVNADTDTTFTYHVQDELGQLSDAVPVTIRVLNRPHTAIFSQGIRISETSIEAVNGVQTATLSVTNEGVETVDTVIVAFDSDDFTVTGGHGTGEILLDAGSGTFVASDLAVGATARLVLTGTSALAGFARLGMAITGATVGGDVMPADMFTSLSIFWQVTPIVADLSLSTVLLVGGAPVGIDEIGVPAGTDFTLRLIAENAPVVSRSADPTVRITFPAGALDLNGILPETADLTYEPVGSDGVQVLTWRPGTLEVGASAVLDLVVSPLVPLENLFRAEVVSSSVADPDSTPGNGASHVFGTEDDEVSVVFYGTPGTPPVGRADSYTVVEGGTLTVLPSQGLLVNDDVLRGSTINVSGSHPGVTLNVAADGGFTFIAPSGITATSVYVYSYTVTDAFGQTSAPATISVQVDDRPSPVGQSDAYVVFEGETLTVDALHGLLANDAPAPDTLLSSDELPAIGTLALGFDGTFTFVAPAAVTEDTYAIFHYVLIDAQGQQSLPIPVTILVANRQLFADVSVEVLPSQPVFDFGTLQQSVTVRVRNDGPSAIDEMQVALSYQDFSLVTANSISGTFAFDTGTGSWTVGTLAAGATADLVITSGTAAGGVTPRLTAEITQVRRSGEVVLDPDSIAGNGTGRGEDDEATGTWSLRAPQADLSVDVGSPAGGLGVISGQIFGVTVDLSNSSALTVGNVVVQVSRGGYGLTAVTPSVGSFDAGTGLWTIGTVEAGAGATLQLMGTSAFGSGNVFARILPATVAGIANQDPDSSNDRDNVSWRTDPARADLGVDVRGGGSGLIAGQNADVTVEISNTRSALAVDNVVVQVYRYGYLLNSFTPSVGSFDAASGLWTVGTLASGGRATLEFSGRTMPPDAQVVANIQSATVFGFANQDPDSSNDRDSLRWSANPARADLGVDVSGGGSSLIAGQNADVTVEISNTRSALTVDNVVVQVYLSGYPLNSLTPSVGSFDAATGLWTVGTLAPGGRATLEFSGRSIPPFAQVVADILSSTVLGFANRDPDSSNNRDSISWSVDYARADLGVDVRRLSSTVPLVDQNVEVEVVVSNDGRSGLTTDNVVVQLSRTNYLASTFTPSMGSYDAATGRWTIGTLAPSGRATLRIAGSSAQAGPAEVSASLGIATVLGFNNQDIVSANNADRESWTVPLPPRPSGLPDDYVTDEGVPLAVSATNGLLANDGPMRFTVVDIVTQPDLGSVTFQPDGSFTYTPPAHVLADQHTAFTYRLRDASGQTSDPIDVAITVRDVIAPADLSLTMQMVVGGIVQSGETFGFDPGEVFTLRLTARNDGPGDADGVAVRLPWSEEYLAVLGTLPEDADLELDAQGYLWRVGTLVLGGTATFDVEMLTRRGGTLVPNPQIVQSASPDPDSTPGNAATTSEDDDARFAIVVENAPPYDPEGEDVLPGFQVEEDTPGVLGVSDLMADDVDPENGVLTLLQLIPGPGTASIVDNRDGSLTFTPARDFHGVATFYYQAIDPEGLPGEPVAVRVVVQPANDPPVALDDAVATNEDTPVTVHLGANDRDIDGDVLVFGTQALLPVGATLGADGRLDFIPPADFTGSVTFEYTVTDNHSPLRTAVVTITVAPVNDAPAAGDDAMTMDEDTTAFVSFASLLANDADVEGDVLTLSVEDALGLTLTVGQQDGEAGVFVASAFPDYNGTASFTYRVSDAHGASDVANVDVTIRPVQDPPRLVVPLLDVQADEDARVAIVLPEEAFLDPDGDPIKYRLLLADGSALPGWLAFDTATRTLSGIPPRDFNGTLSIRVMAVEQPEVLAGPAVLASATSFTVNFDGTPLIRLAPASDTEAAGDDMTRDRTPTFEGDAPASAAMIRLEFLDASLAAVLPTQFALVEADGHWTATADAALLGRIVLVRASALDENGVDLGTGPLVRATLALELTGSPLIGLDPASDTGTPGDGMTEDLTPTLFGEAPSGATSVRLAFESGSGAAVANSVVVPVEADGQWTYTPTDRLAPAAMVGGRPTTNSLRHITATALDAAGNALTPTSVLNTGVLSLRLTGSPVIRLASLSDTDLPGDNVTNDRTPTLEGDLPVGTPAVRLEFYDAGGQAFGTPVTITVGQDGHWTFTPQDALTTSSRTSVVNIVAYAVDHAGVAVGNGGLLRGFLELRFAGSPLLTLDPGSDTGTAFDDVTEDRTPTLRGTLPAGASSVRLSFVDANRFALGEVTVQAGTDGHWSYTPVEAFSLALGQRGRPETLLVTALALDATGNALAPATYENSAVLDIRLTGSPLMRLAAASDTGVPGDNITSDRTPTLDGSASVHAASVSLQFRDGATGEIVMPDAVVSVAADGSWHYTPQAAFLGRSAISITATAWDASGIPLSPLTALDRTILDLTFQGSMLIQLDPDSDTGVPFDQMTTDYTPTFFGEAPLGTDIVVLTLRDGPAGQEDTHAIVVPVGDDGRWQWTPLRPLATSITRTGTLRLVVNARAIDLDGHYADDVFDLEILPTQDPPHAVGDTYTTRENTAMTIPVGAGLLANDHDVDGDVLTIASYGQGLAGTVTVGVDGAFVYTPEIGFRGTDSFVYHVTDGVSTSLAMVTVNVQARLLEVVSLTPNDSGFAVRFNREIDTAQVNLYDAADVAMGAADVVLTGRSTGVVKGTLVLDADASGFTFVKTGGVLAPDTYSVSIRSADGGFIDILGFSLDGNADGIGGDDASATFTVTPASSPLLSIADMVRGPGQSANLPLTVVGGAGVTGLSFDVVHDAEQVQIDDIVFAAGYSGSIERTAFAGGTHVTVTLNAALTAGSLTPLRVLASVPASAQYGTVGRVALQSVKLTYGTSGATENVRTDAGIVVGGYFMDTSGNRAYSMLDVQRLQRVVTGLDSGFGAYATVDPVLVGDFNGNGQLTSLDVSRLLLYVQGTPRAEIPALPAGSMPIVFDGTQRVIGLAGSTSALAGDSVSVALTLDDTTGVESLTARIVYDAARLDYRGVRLLTDFPYKIVRQIPGEIVLDLARLGTMTADIGDLLAIDFDVRSDAALGDAAIDLQVLQVNEGRIGAVDVSVPGADATDVRITVLAEASALAVPAVSDAATGNPGMLKMLLAALSEAHVAAISAASSSPQPTQADVPRIVLDVPLDALPQAMPGSIDGSVRTDVAKNWVAPATPGDWTPASTPAVVGSIDAWKNLPWVKDFNQRLVKVNTDTNATSVSGQADASSNKTGLLKRMLSSLIRR